MKNRNTIALFIVLAGCFWLVQKPRAPVRGEMHFTSELENVSAVDKNQTAHLKRIQSNPLAQPVAASRSEAVPLGPAKTLDELKKRYGVEFSIDRVGDVPFRIKGTVPGSQTEDIKERSYDFIAEAALLLQIDALQSLPRDRVTERAGTLGKILTYQQYVDGVPVDGAEVVVFHDAKGAINGVNSTFVTGLPPLDVHLKDRDLQAGEAAKIAADLAMAARDPQGHSYPITQQGAPELLIHGFRNQSGQLTGYALAWHVMILQMGRGGQAVGQYYMNVRNAAEVERVEGAVE